VVYEWYELLGMGVFFLYDTFMLFFLYKEVNTCIFNVLKSCFFSYCMCKIYVGVLLCWFKMANNIYFFLWKTESYKRQNNSQNN
jgi:hypothetical protein